MTKDDIQLLYEYDRWANNRVLQKASELSEEQFTRDLGGSFRSVRDTLVHIIGGEWGWLAYWKEPPHSSAFSTDLRARRDALFNPDAFFQRRCGAGKVGGSREKTDRVRESRDKRIIGKNASFSYNPNQIGAPDATSGEPFVKSH
jgi:hypothetical protein